MPAIQVADLNNGKVDVDHVGAFANSTALTAMDRLGRTKRTLAGIDAEAESRMDAHDAAAIAQRLEIAFEANAMLAALGYQVPVAYEAGLDMTTASQTVDYDGNTYAPIKGELPFTTSGIFESTKFRLIQGVSGADLAAPSGALMVGVQQDVPESVARNARSVLSDFVSARTFGVVGDGAADDTPGFLKALISSSLYGTQVNWHDMQVRITNSALATLSRDFYWKGDGAQFLNYSAAHKEYLLRLSAVAKTIAFEGIGFNGRSLANKLLDVLGTGVATMDDANRLFIRGGLFENVRRIAALNHGDAIRVEGGFSLIDISGGARIRNVVMATGAGTPTVVGVTGVTTYGNNINAYPSRVLLRDISVENVRAEDTTYTFDQDGVRCFGPHVASAGAYVPNEMVVDNCDFLNCYGRSVKSQSFVNRVGNSRFRRTAGLAAGVGNTEVNFQIGGGTVENCTFDYKNGQDPGLGGCVGGGFLAGYAASSVRVTACEVFIDAATTLKSFFSTDASTGGHVGKCTVRGTNVYGKVERFVNYSINGQGNSLTVGDNYVQELTLGPTGERALIYLVANGGTSPYVAKVFASDNTYGTVGHLPAVVRDSIPGNVAQAMLDSRGNAGFSNVKSVVPNTNGLKASQIARIGRIGPAVDDVTFAATNFSSGFFETQTQNIANGATVSFPVLNITGAQLLVQASANAQAFAFISSQSTLTITINKGTAFEVGNTADPGIGTYRVWSGANEIFVMNTSGSARQFTVHQFCPG